MTNQTGRRRGKSARRAARRRVQGLLAQCARAGGLPRALPVSRDCLLCAGEFGGCDCGDLHDGGAE